MKKPNTTTDMPRLHQAVCEIIYSVRLAAHRSVGHSPDDLNMRVPVLFKGTDMRVIIEAGPVIAMRNAIEHAQMQATDKPAKTPGLDARLEAIALLGIYASEIKDCNTRIGSEDWLDTDIEKHFHRIIDAVQALEAEE